MLAWADFPSKFLCHLVFSEGVILQSLIEQISRITLIAIVMFPVCVVRVASCLCVTFLGCIVPNVWAAYFFAVFDP
jgi:hypothetical protein